MWVKGVGGLIKCKYCIRMYVNEKMRPVETISGRGERDDKGEQGGGGFIYDIFDTL
jgi:hypothetical protein